MGTGDALAVVTGILGIAAGKMLNKGLLIAYMVLGIICALWFAAAIPLFSAATLVCGAVNDVVDGACQNAAGEPYCCFACDVDTCGGAGCMWQGPYTDGYCYVPAGAPEVESPCDKNCCGPCQKPYQSGTMMPEATADVVGTPVPCGLKTSQPSVVDAHSGAPLTCPAWNSGDSREVSYNCCSPVSNLANTYPVSENEVVVSRKSVPGGGMPAVNAQ